MANRLKSLKRVEAVQKQLVRRSELRLVAAERACRQIAEDKALLETYVVTEGALGQPLAKAAIQSFHRLEALRLRAEQTRAVATKAVETSKCRERAIGDLTTKVARATRRAFEDRELVTLVESLLSDTQASGKAHQG